MASNEKPDWYQTDVQSINPEAQQLLESYSGLAPDDVLPHVLSLVGLTLYSSRTFTNSSQREEAFGIYHYACIGQMRFLSFNLSHMPFYPRVLEKLRSDPEAGFLDAGCCFGQELRFLANQGIPGTRLFGCDLEQVFIDLGYQLFRDKDRLRATFAVGDLDAANSDFETGQLTQKLSGKLDVVFASSLFHMWDYDIQFRVAARLVKLCRDKPGVMITGRQIGSLVGGHYEMKGMKDGAFHYRHDIETMERFWSEIGEATSTTWKVEAGLYSGEEVEKTKNMPWSDDNYRMMWWCATRQ